MTSPSLSRDAITLLRNDHKEVESLFKRCEKLMKGEQPSPELRELCERISDELTMHTAIEEQIFYPAMKQALESKDVKMIFESYEEHHVLKGLLSELRQMKTMDQRFNAKLKVLMEVVRHHVKEEEGELFPHCREVCGRKLMRDIGATMLGYKRQLLKEESLKPGHAPPADAAKVDEVLREVAK
jgi:hemerythrin superfamily protein